MKKTTLSYDCLLPAMLLACLFLAVILLRPLLPVDEMRYMSVAWEMFLRGDWLAPLTVNFQPYHHKPPLLFWLINASWAAFGVSRWAGTLPILASAVACLCLTRTLAAALFADDVRITRTVPFVLTGSLTFLMVGLLVMFDITLTVFVLLTLIALLSFARSGLTRHLLWMAAAMGLGVLTKGPVAWLYVLFPMLTGPLWLPKPMGHLKWYGGCLCAFLLSVVPVLLWLIPMLSQASGDFAYRLVWEQTMGRVTGRFVGSHARPVFFYLPFLPVLCLPWLFFPSFRRGLKGLKKQYQDQWAIRFLVLWIVPLFIAFSLIRGKQPHYLVPFLPAVAILIASMTTITEKTIRNTALIMAAFVMALHGIGSLSLFKRFDLEPMVRFLDTHKNVDWAYLGNYHGELGFLGRLEKAVDESHDITSAEKWFQDHPDGLAILRYRNPELLSRYDVVFDMPFRGKRICVFKRPR
ncbi:hypothetical protein JCM14469_33520 [Desulfatiferula olefinivorans]